MKASNSKAQRSVVLKLSLSFVAVALLFILQKACKIKREDVAVKQAVASILLQALGLMLARAPARFGFCLSFLLLFAILGKHKSSDSETRLSECESCSSLDELCKQVTSLLYASLSPTVKWSY